MNEIEVHEREADTWWNPESKMSYLNSFNPPRFAYFSQFISDWQGLNLLDVGCGGGFTSEYLAEKGAIVNGIDISSKLIETAKHHANLQSLSIEYQQASAETLPYEDSVFDIVVCVDVLEHVSDVSGVISEVSRVLKSNGLFFFDTINKTDASQLFMIGLCEKFLNVLPKGTHDWNKFIEPETLKKLLVDNGFTEIEMKGFELKGRDGTTGAMVVDINYNMNVMYIGKAVLAA